MNRRAWQLAGRQHGIITRRDLIDLGFTAKAVSHRVAIGRLHPLGRGVYAVGWPELTPKRRWMAAVLACGKGAVLSHSSAAALWGFGAERGNWIDVSVRHRTPRRRAGLAVRNRPSLPDVDVTRHEGIPVTQPARTMVDLATQLGPNALERAVNEADKLGLLVHDDLRRSLPSFAGEPGVRALRALLDRNEFRLSDSVLEVRFRRLAEAAGLPPPLTKASVNGFEVDFFWPDLGLVVETDGLRYHRTPSAQARDQLRDQAHTAAGLATLRFTHHQVRYRPAHVRSILIKTARRLRRGAACLDTPQGG